MEGLFAGGLVLLPPLTQAFWLATADMASGDRESARRKLEDLLPQADQLVRAGIQRRLAQVGLPRQPLDAVAEGILDNAAQEQEHEETFAARRCCFQMARGATQLLIAANLVMFAVEVWQGGSTNEKVLLRLGAFSAPDVLQGQWWRLVTPLFLHFGPLHLAMNMFGLWLLGPFTEFALGLWRFLSVYLAAGIGSTAVVLLASMAKDEREILVGASGAIMGLVGAVGALMLRGWLREKRTSPNSGCSAFSRSWPCRRSSIPWCRK